MSTDWKSDVQHVLEGILPWLGARRLAKAEEALAYIRSRPPGRRKIWESPE